MPKWKATIWLLGACLVLAATIPSAANQRQVANPVWGGPDVQGLVGSTAAYQMNGLDFDPGVAGLELKETFLSACAIESVGGGMIRVKRTVRLRFRSTVDGTVAYTTNNLIMRSQPFPDPFDATNQTAGDLNHAYLDDLAGDVTFLLQQAVTAAADPTATLCDEVGFPRSSVFGINMAVSGAQHTLIVADSMTGGYALKAAPTDLGWNGVTPVEGIGVFQYWAIEATPAASKGSLLHQKIFNAQSELPEATPFWNPDTAWSLLGDIRGSGQDVVRLVDLMPHPTPGLLHRRTRHFNVRTGALVGAVVRDVVAE